MKYSSILVIIAVGYLTVAETQAKKNSDFINRELVEAIKLKAETWKPFEIEQNPFLHKEEGYILSMIGQQDYDKLTGSIFQTLSQKLKPVSDSFKNSLNYFKE